MINSILSIICILIVLGILIMANDELCKCFQLPRKLGIVEFNQTNIKLNEIKPQFCGKMRSNNYPYTIIDKNYDNLRKILNQ